MTKPENNETDRPAQLLRLHPSNPRRTVLYTGVTNDLKRRLAEHVEKSDKDQPFTGKYNTFGLVYWEHFGRIEDAIAREKQIKGWSRKKKEELIAQFNPLWTFLNDKV